MPYTAEDLNALHSLTASPDTCCRALDLVTRLHAAADAEREDRPYADGLSALKRLMVELDCVIARPDQYDPDVFTDILSDAGDALHNTTLA